MTDHNHSHDKQSVSNKIGLAFFLNLGFSIFEFFGGMLTNSLAITSDALHDFGDAISLGISWFLEKKSQQKRSEDYSYGYGRLSLLGAIITGFILLIGSFVIIKNALPRILHPETVRAESMVAFAIIGIIVNGIAALKLMKTESKNAKFVFYHMLEDVLGWFAILLSSIVMLFIDAPYIDVVLSLIIVIYILFSVVKNLIQTIGLLLQKVPDEFNLNDIENKLSEKFECRVHDVHLWTLDGEKNVFSAHVVIEKNVTLRESDQIKIDIKSYLKGMGIDHSTIEVECSGDRCGQLDC